MRCFGPGIIAFMQGLSRRIIGWRRLMLCRLDLFWEKITLGKKISNFHG